MNDYDEQLLEGTPGLTPEQAEFLESEQKRLDNMMPAAQVELEQFQEAAPQVSELEATAENMLAPPEQQEQPVNPNQERIEKIQKSVSPKSFAERYAAIPTSIIDTTLDAINLLPGVDIPKLPKFENDVAQSVREISSVVAPTILLSGFGGAALAGRAAATGGRAGRVLNDPFVKYIGSRLFPTGVGAGVDYVAEISQEGDNLTGILKKTWPRTYGWIPEDIATLDRDSAETKRNKTVYEGVGLGIGIDVLQGAAKLAGAVGGMSGITRHVPETEKAKNWFKRNLVKESDTVDDVIEEAAAARSDALDEIGGYNVSKKTVNTEVPLTGREYYIEESAAKAEGVEGMSLDDARNLYAQSWENLDAATRSTWDNLAIENPRTRIETTVDTSEPIFGYHDMYGYQESGIRSVDHLGIVGASIDNARILNNIDTVYGRIGNSVSEGALKFSLEGVENQQSIQRGLADVLSEADDYGYQTHSGRYLSSADIKDAGDRLAATFYEMNVDDMRRVMAEYQTVNTTTGLPVLTDEASKGVTKALKKYMDDYVNMNYMRAQAYVGTSMAGQISDLAQGVRLTEGTPAIVRATEQILDRIEFLTVQKELSNYSNNRFKQMFSLFNTLSRSEADKISIKEAKRIEQVIRGEADRTASAAGKIKEDAKFFVDNLRQISKEMPESLRGLLLAYEMTDGNVKTITQLNKYLKNKYGVFNKMLIDRNPEIESTVMKGFWSIIYNATLGRFGTPLKAALQTGEQIIEKPVRVMVGALRNDDIATMRRAWYQYNNVIEALQSSFDYAKQAYKRAGLDDPIVPLRENYGTDSQSIELIETIAAEYAAKGEYGPQFMADIVKAQHGLQKHPWLRFGQNGLSAIDGFSSSMFAFAEARGNVYDQITRNGALPLNKTEADKLYKQAYDKMFDANGVITDEAVKKTAGEVNLNLDNPLTQSLSTLISYFPGLKGFLLFNRSPINELKLAASFNPLGAFVKDLGAFSRPFDEVPAEELQKLLASRGVDFNAFNARAKYNEIRADLRGRKDLGTLAVTGAVGLFLGGNITGNGLYDKQKQAVRTTGNKSWQPRSIRVPGVGWVSYDSIGPWALWMATVVDIMDNGLDYGISGALGTTSSGTLDVGENLKKMGFVLSSAITDRTSLSGLEQLMEALSGNGEALNRWATTTLASAAIPNSSLMAETARLLEPGRKMVEMDFVSRMKNRLPVLRGTLPSEYDWIDGGEVGVPDDVFTRLWNNYMPWKINGEVSPRKQFLIDIEYDARPTLNSIDGIELTKEQQANILSIIGREQLFGAAIDQVMERTNVKEFRKNYKEAVAEGFNPQLSEFKNVHSVLDSELRKAMRLAIAISPDQEEISRKNIEQETVGLYLRQGDQQGAREFVDKMKQFSY